MHERVTYRFTCIACLDDNHINSHHLTTSLDLNVLAEYSEFFARADLDRRVRCPSFKPNRCSVLQYGSRWNCLSYAETEYSNITSTKSLCMITFSASLRGPTHVQFYLQFYLRRPNCAKFALFRLREVLPHPRS